jgi:hypothetical protein
VVPDVSMLLVLAPQPRRNEVNTACCADHLTQLRGLMWGVMFYIVYCPTHDRESHNRQSGSQGPGGKNMETNPKLNRSKINKAIDQSKSRYV